MKKEKRRKKNGGGEAALRIVKISQQARNWLLRKPKWKPACHTESKYLKQAKKDKKLEKRNEELRMGDAHTRSASLYGSRCSQM